MAEITHGGLWIRWSSLSGRDKRDFALSMLLMTIGGGIVGGLTAMPESATPVPVGIGTVLMALSPILPIGGGTLLYFRFVARQDELFRFFHIYTSLWAAGGMALATVAGILLRRMPGMDVIELSTVLMAGAVASLIGGLVANRKYL